MTHERESFLPLKLVTKRKFAELTGITTDAIEARIRTGVWLKGREYFVKRNRTYVDLLEYDKWVRAVDEADLL